MIAGAAFLASLNSCRTRLAPTPTNTSTNSDPLILKNGTFASPATARLMSVLPVPGGPASSTPFGMRAPSVVKRSGAFRNSTISDNSSLASSAPATSAKVTFGRSARPALDLPVTDFASPPGLALSTSHTTKPRMVSTSRTCPMDRSIVPGSADGPAR